MNILSIHNRYQIRGGEDESREAEERLLRENNHTVDVYEDHNDRVAQLGNLRVALRTVWSMESYQSVRERLKKNPYDLIHVQNFFPLISPSVYYAAKAEGIPVVQSLRNYRLLCANSFFFREGRVCEDCMGKVIPWPGVVHACYRDNSAGSATVVAMQTVHRALQTWTKMVDVYVTLTHFARSKFIEAGLPAEKIVVKPNFVSADPGVGEGKGGYAFFVGRLSPEKGLETMLAAWERLDKRIPLKIVGDGPLAALVEQAVQRLPNVEWLGRRPLSEVYDLMGEAKFIIFPSEWYETFGRVAIEAFAKGTPAIAANIGAIAELVDRGRTGLFFRPGDANDLVRQVEFALDRPRELAEMRREARAEFEAKYTAERNYQLLMKIYTRAKDFH
ncbi:glycosyltransferase family 4 protein [Phormidium sp. CCY1219]|uniref:glycosyltransferase family 4 protein n=1 Tax=Phormidium sp. CCY1219 TaxID=2886104 RepID=UPI002D1F2D5E|nr:glycosyltransferase family 4 protein [Phormidium sp. CCY1219]MEB3829831.1 glycosyltransferase family 4 protein [Phormidium sp. CCY1219]